MITKISFVVLSIILVLKLLIWQFYDFPINRSSVLVILILITFIIYKNKYTWIFGLLFLIFSLIAILINFNLSTSDSWTINPFFFLDSIKNSLQLKTNNIWYYSFNIFTLFFYITLIVVFLNPKFKRSYFQDKMEKGFEIS
jgi:hypothetical protein